MKIQVKELGAIKEGVIDLSKKLTVFCGPNGTGKTYMAYLIYSITKANIHVGVGNTNTLVNELIDKKELTLQINFTQIEDYKEKLIQDVLTSFDRLFGLGSEDATNFFKGVEIINQESSADFKEQLVKSSFKSSITIGGTRIFISKEINATDFKLQIEETTISKESLEALHFFLFNEYLSFLATYPISSSSIFPVERNSIYTFSKELSLSRNDAIDHLHAVANNKKLSTFDLLFKRTTRYPMPIRDGLVIAEDLANIKKTKSNYFSFAEQIENELLHGKVVITNDGEIQFKSDKAPKKQLPIHLTASIIKTLSSLVVFLKHIAKENDLIIIDEPEINLHPDNQIILTKLFARLINNGFRLLISTHSDYIVRELNNLIMLSSTKEEVNKLREKFHYKKDEVILKDDIGVYYFNYPQKARNNKQIVVDCLDITDSGFEIPSIDKTIDDQNKIAEELYYSLKYGGENE